MLPIVEPKPKRATLKALQTADGFWRIKVNQAAVGKVYTADVNSIRIVTFVNQPTGTQFNCEVVDVLDEEFGTWDHFPTELLDIEK